jgi:outer membrane immunogenic protein
MRRVLLATAAISLLGPFFGPGLATAADMPLKAPPIAYGPSWTGFYAGVDLGYGWKDDPTVTATGNDPLSIRLLSGLAAGGQPLGPVSFGNKGVFGGVEAGYNWQLYRSWLVGIETDFNVSNIHGQGSASSIAQSGIPGLPDFTQQLTASQNVQWFGTVRPRAGWLATDNLLLYGTGGFAYGRVTEQVNYGLSPAAIATVGNFTLSCAAVPAQCVYGTSSRIATGWTAGGGAEYRVPGTSASFKVEYLYVNLGAGDTVQAVAQSFTAGTNPTSLSAAFTRTDFHTVKAGLNWHF